MARFKEAFAMLLEADNKKAEQIKQLQTDLTALTDKVWYPTVTQPWPDRYLTVSTDNHKAFPPLQTDTSATAPRATAGGIAPDRPHRTHRQGRTLTDRWTRTNRYEPSQTVSTAANRYKPLLPLQSLPGHLYRRHGLGGLEGIKQLQTDLTALTDKVP
jgi:hypothetical protein